MAEFLIHLRHEPGLRDAVLAELRLRAALKRLLRDHKLRVVDVKLVKPDPKKKTTRD